MAENEPSTPYTPRRQTRREPVTPHTLRAIQKLATPGRRTTRGPSPKKTPRDHLRALSRAIVQERTQAALYKEFDISDDDIQASELDNDGANAWDHGRAASETQARDQTSKAVPTNPHDAKSLHSTPERQSESRDIASTADEADDTQERDLSVVPEINRGGEENITMTRDHSIVANTTDMSLRDTTLSPRLGSADATIDFELEAALDDPISSGTASRRAIEESFHIAIDDDDDDDDEVDVHDITEGSTQGIEREVPVASPSQQQPPAVDYEDYHGGNDFGDDDYSNSDDSDGNEREKQANISFQLEEVHRGYSYEDDLDTTVSATIPKVSGTSARQKRSPRQRRVRTTTAVSHRIVKDIVKTLTSARITAESMDAIVSGSEAFFKQATLDVAAYANHAKRKTIDPSDVLQLMRRQRLTNDKVTAFSLAHKYLPAELLDEITKIA
jgi:histone H3/H4